MLIEISLKYRPNVITLSVDWTVLTKLLSQLHPAHIRVLSALYERIHSVVMPQESIHQGR